MPKDVSYTWEQIYDAYLKGYERGAQHSRQEIAENPGNKNNSDLVQLLCNMKELLLNFGTPPKEARAHIIKGINAALAQQHQIA